MLADLADQVETADANAFEAKTVAKRAATRAEVRETVGALDERMSMLERAWAQGEQQAKETKNRPSRRAGPEVRPQPALPAGSCSDARLGSAGVAREGGWRSRSKRP